MRKTIILSIVMALLSVTASADSKETVQVNGSPVGKFATRLTFSGDNVTLTYDDGTNQTSDISTVSIAFDYVAVFKEANHDNVGVIKTFGGRTVSVEATRTLASGQWTFICLPFAVSSQEMKNLDFKAYEFDGLTDDGSIHFKSVEAMEANKPYVLIAGEEDTPFMGLSSREIIQTDGLTTTADEVSFIGTMKRKVLNSGESISYYGYSNGSFVKVGSNVGINPFRAYISTSQTLGQSINAVFEDISGIHEISRQKTKDAESLYTLDGRRAHAKNGSLPKGVYIQGGKKIVIK